MQAAAWDEESELRELNSRLRAYVSRVRDLEQENRRLAQEVAALRGRERGGVCRPQQERHAEEELAELRLVVAELRRAKGAAELEREALRRELARLESLGAQSEELRRRRLEPELAEERQQLERLRADCAALEALLERLQVEHRRLREARRRHPGKLPALPPPRRTQALSRRRQREREDSCALVLSWSCEEESLERYYEAELRALQELEGRLGRENVQELRAHNEQSRRQLQELHRRCRELSALAERLEQERRAQGERQGAELAEYQMIIEALTQEKQFLTMSIAEYLKDYHELLQVKAGLSLEIATYRALLEGESSQWILMWDKEHGRKLPQGVRNMLYEYSNRHSAYQREKGKRAVPAIQNVDVRYKMPVTSISSSSVYSSQTKIDGTQTAAPWKTLRKDAFRPEYRPSAAIEKDVALGRTVTDQREFKSFTRPYLASQESDVQRRMLPERKRTEAGSTASFFKESTAQKVVTSPYISGNVRTKVAVPTSFPSYSLNSGSKETKYERTVEGTHTRANEQIKDSKPVKEQKPVFIEERETKEEFAKDITDSGLEKLHKKSTGVESTVNFEKKIEIKRGTDERKHTMEELIIKDNRKEDRSLGDKKDEKYVRWEERIRADTSENDFSADKKKNLSMATQSKDASEISIHSEVPIFGQTLENKNIEITLQDSKPSVIKTKDEPPSKLSRESYRNRESEEGSSKIGNLLTESIAENIVSDILKDVVQKSSDAGTLPDTKVTSFEKKEVLRDGKMKTEVSIQSTVQEDLNARDEFGLGSFLKKDVKKVLEDSKGTLAEGIIKDIINAGLEAGADKGKRSVKVEIVEEPVGCTADVQMEFSTPFEVEEAEDTLPGVAQHVYYGDEERATTSSAKDLKQKQPTVIVSHVEDVSEGDDVVDEEKYFVSTPDEQPSVHEQDKSSIYGQIHIEEESTITYSWQDEFLQGSQAKMNEGMDSPEWTYQVMGEEAEGAFTLKGDMPKEQVARAESIVIEREIKIPHEFQESLKGILSQETKDPKHQLKKALEKLEDTFPESVKQELSALTKEDQADSSSLEVDIKKVKHAEKGGLVTIVAEVNLSQTLDSDQFNTGYLGDGVTDEIKSPTQFPDGDGFDKYRKQESEIFSDYRNKVGIDVSSTEDASRSSRLSGSDRVEYHANEQVFQQGPVFQSMERDSRGDAFHSQASIDSNRSVRQIRISPTEILRTEQVLYEHPISETLELRTGASADVSQSVKEFKLGPEGTETTEEIIYRGPVHKTVDVSGPEGPSHVQFSTDVRSTKHLAFGPKQIIEEITFEGSTSDMSSSDSSEALSQIQAPVETSRSIRRIQINPQEVHAEQIIFEGPLSGFVEVSSAGDHIVTKESIRHIRLGQKDTPVIDQTIREESSPQTTQPSHDSDRLFKEGMLDSNTTVRQIKLSPKELLTTTDQVVFTGPISEHLEFGESGPTFSSEGSVRRIRLGQKEVFSSEHVMYQGSVSESSGISSPGEDILETEGPAEISRSFRHIKLSPAETHAEQIVLQGPVSETLRLGVADLSPTDGPSESNRSAGHIKIGPTEKSFTFQMDVTSVAGGGQEATILVPNWKGNASKLEGQVMGGQKDTGNEPRSEESTFNQTVQLQRMVDQRSVISDEKKIALVYLNEEEEEEEEDGPWF